MTRPEIIRADSIDLQDSDSPSAQDHSGNSATLGAHQASTLREVAAEIAGESRRSPRVSKEWSSSEVQHLHQYGDSDLASGLAAKLNDAYQQQEELDSAQNGGLSSSAAEDADLVDGEGDDGMDDDMMDKISSSPSIDDGGYSLPPLWPVRLDSIMRKTRTLPKSSSFTQACNESSSPSVETPDHYPLIPITEELHDNTKQVSRAEVISEVFRNRHLEGEYVHDCEQSTDSDDDQPQPSGSRTDYGDYTSLSDTYTARSGSQFLEYRYPGSISEQRLDFREGPYFLDSEFDGLLTIPYESTDDEDDDDDEDYTGIPYTENSRFVDSGWSGECLQESEDIDFEFVYALHTFVATVEGQANATKGDTMVLLDDSNSYWWLVRVVKDSSIGYLPAEHIETPTERLARLNKHRNIDLTSAMLGDQAEKSMNPLKKAIRRRNAKTVTFTAPTYVEASDIDYSTDEDEGDQEITTQQGQMVEENEEALIDDANAVVEPLKPLREPRAESPEGPESEAVSEPTKISTGIEEGKLESNKSRNGTVRNTDSFFKDDSVETRKITLTPNLLRDDSSTSTRTSNDSKELKQRPSLDNLEKDSQPEKVKDKKEKKEKKDKDKKEKKEKKDKDKKPGMLSGLFKRKEKRSKTQDEEINETIAGKPSGKNVRDSPGLNNESEETGSAETQKQQPRDVQRSASKLQKQPRLGTSAALKAGLATKSSDLQQAPAPDRPPSANGSREPSMRLVKSDSRVNDDSIMRRHVLEATKSSDTILEPSQAKSESASSKMLRSTNSTTPDLKPIKTKKAKSRVELDDFDSSPEVSPLAEPARAYSIQTQRPIPGSFPDSYISTNIREGEDQLSESPIQISPIAESHTMLPALMIDTSSQEEPPSPVSSEMSPSLEVDDADDVKKGLGNSTASTSIMTWSDSQLRIFFDDDADIKDLLIVVYDKSGVTPAGPDHPIIGNLFREENAKLAEITTRLDGMLGDWLARKTKAQASP